MRLFVDARQVEQLAEAMAKAPDVVRERLLDAMTEADLLLEREAKEGAPVGVGGGGGLRGSIFSEETVTGDTIRGIVSSPLPYASVVELGRRPGKMPPVQPILDWVEHKLGLRDRAAESAAWAIAKKIQRKGTAGARMFGRALEAQERTVQRIFSAAADRIIGEVLA